MTEALGVESFDLVPHLGAVAIAYVLSLPIGWNREKAERSAGLRTFPLVAIAACGFIEATEAVAGESPEAVARIVEGVIVGMGFVGGGAILKHGENVRGTATAAALWATGAMGVAVGLGKVDVAVLLAVITAATLYFISPLKRELIGRDGDAGEEGKGDIA